MPIGPFTATRYIVRGRWFGLFGRLHIEAEDGRPVASGIVRSRFFVSGISVVSGEWPEREQFVIEPRPKSPMSDVVVAASGERIGGLRLKRGTPFGREQWTVLDAEDEQIGVLQEESLPLAWLNRRYPWLVPRRFRGEVEGRQACTLRQHFNPLVMKFEVDCRDDTAHAMDPRLVIALALLICTLGRQG